MYLFEKSIFTGTNQHHSPMCQGKTTSYINLITLFPLPSIRSYTILLIQQQTPQNPSQPPFAKGDGGHVLCYSDLMTFLYMEITVRLFR